jgi:hypothetical protein
MAAEAAHEQKGDAVAEPAFAIAKTNAPTTSHTVLSENPLNIQRSDLAASGST